MEHRNDDPELAREIVQLGAVWEDILRLKTRFRLVLPDDLSRVKEELGRLHAGDFRRRAGDYDLFYRLGIVLAKEEIPRTMGELSSELGVPQSTATRMVDWLVSGGYAERLEDPEDRRIVRVRLTETGRTLYEACREFVQRRAGQILGQFTSEERRQLVVLLGKLVRALAGNTP